jgi:hypothetical protein
MVSMNFIYFCHLHRNYRLKLGEFGDNSCWLLISPAQLTQTLIRVLLMEPAKCHVFFLESAKRLLKKHLHRSFSDVAHRNDSLTLQCRYLLFISTHLSYYNSKGRQPKRRSRRRQRQTREQERHTTTNNKQSTPKSKNTWDTIAKMSWNE